MRETLATILWEGWTALVLCAAAVFLPCLLYTSPSPRDA